VEKSVILALQAAYDKKGEDIMLLDLRKTFSLLCDYFLIITGNSKEHVRAIADHIEETLKENGVTLDHMEGYTAGKWVLLDYGDFVVHIMQKDIRVFYSLEDLWGDFPSLSYPEDFKNELQREN